ncbi:MAG TPA: hypothetical protein PKU95_02385 [Candidatus Dojkabacteria bacterium]|nr:hypothetical protein [Candidatus Dojkabacteria bacterium]
MQQRAYAKNGFATLFSLIILMVIAVSVFSSILLTNIDGLKGVEAMRNGIVAKNLATSCAEIAINKLKIADTYSGNETINFTEGSCYIQTISGSGNTNRLLRVTGTSENAIKKIEINVLVINPTTNISYWIEKDF